MKRKILKVAKYILVTYLLLLAAWHVLPVVTGMVGRIWRKNVCEFNGNWSDGRCNLRRMNYR